MLQRCRFGRTQTQLASRADLAHHRLRIGDDDAADLMEAMQGREWELAGDGAGHSNFVLADEVGRQDWLAGRLDAADALA